MGKRYENDFKVMIVELLKSDVEKGSMKLNHVIF